MGSIQRVFGSVWCAAAILAGCGGSAGPTDEPAATTKVEAALARQAGRSDGDVCRTQKWYGDGVCDTFCPNADVDCSPKPGDPIVCALFIEPSDGKCTRPADDPCRMQDPDCVGPTPPPSGDPVAHDPALVCALYIEPSDGKCTRPADDPCRMQDPDCVGPTPPPPGGPYADEVDAGGNHGGLNAGGGLTSPQQPVGQEPCGPSASPRSNCPPPVVPEPCGQPNCSPPVVPEPCGQPNCPPTTAPVPCGPNAAGQPGCSPVGCVVTFNNVCFSSIADGCKAAGCELGSCVVLEARPVDSKPAQVGCSHTPVVDPGSTDCQAVYNGQCFATIDEACSAAGCPMGAYNAAGTDTCVMVLDTAPTHVQCAVTVNPVP